MAELSEYLNTLAARYNVQRIFSPTLEYVPTRPFVNSWSSMVPHELLTLLFLHPLRITWQQPRLSRTSLIVTAFDRFVFPPQE